MNLTLISIVLLCTAVTIGLYLIFLGVRKHQRSPRLGLTHACLALAGFLVLFAQIYTGPVDKLNNVAALFLFFALIGGGMVFALREENRPPSMIAVGIHGVAGLIGIAALIINLY